MEKFKYLIILILSLLSAVLFYEYDEYKQISKKLISQNNNLDIELQKLHRENLSKQNTIEQLNIQIDEQNHKILTLEKQLMDFLVNINEPKTLLEHSLETEDEQTVQNKENFEENLNSTNEKSMFDLPVDPKIKMDENNKIESFEFQIEKNF